MKNILTILVALFCLAAAAKQTDSVAMQESVNGANAKLSSVEEIWDAANNAYMQNDYSTAVDLYIRLLESGKHSSKLYYNLGNAYFKQNQLGQAILNYNRAQLLNPRNEDISYNLALANTRTVDKIEDVPEFFLIKWAKEVGFTFNSNIWTILGLTFLAIALAAMILWLISNSIPLRKSGFYGAIIAVFLCIISFTYAQSARLRQIDSRYGIVMNTAAPVKSSPSEGSKDIFILHEGTKFMVTETLDNWYEIVIADGNKGWISQSAVELINKLPD